MTTHPTPTSGTRSTRPVGHLPVEGTSAVVTGPRWALLLTSMARPFAPLARLLDRVAVIVVWAAVPVGVGAVLTGHERIIGLTSTGIGYRPGYLILAGIAALILGGITADVIGFGRTNRAITRAEHARRTEAARVVDGTLLPDDPALNGPNGFTGSGTSRPSSPLDPRDRR